jgi:diguanylate cyclase (GGDEF)-like protein
LRGVAKSAETGRPAVQSDATRLATEVERLERELAAARRQMAALEALADLDPLTELPNRRAFERELARSIAYIKRHGTPAALLYLDLDAFKVVNDRSGHAAGDVVLKAIGGDLRRYVRASDVVARIGGDEFAVLLWNCDDAGASAKALVLEQEVARTAASHNGAPLMIGASVGATLLLPLDQPGAALARADAAMYARKAAKRRMPAAE